MGSKKTKAAWNGGLRCLARLVLLRRSSAGYGLDQ